MEVAKLSAQMEAGFAAVTRRFDRTDHALGRLEAQVQQTNGRVTELELHRRVTDSIREHDLHPEHHTLTVASMEWALKYGGWVAAGAIAAWQLLRVFP